MLLASMFAAFLALGTLPAAWADDVVLALVGSAAGCAGIFGWTRWVPCEREMLTALRWSGEESRKVP